MTNQAIPLPVHRNAASLIDPATLHFFIFLRKGKPYSERHRRREIEAQGRIHSTLLRLPELVAQTEADARARAEDSDNTDSLAADRPAHLPLLSVGDASRAFSRILFRR
jgi:hypothetical protein